MQYIISNNKDSESYEKTFPNSNEASHWINNHLDLSKEWNMTIKLLFKVNIVNLILI